MRVTARTAARVLAGLAGLSLAAGCSVGGAGLSAQRADADRTPSSVAQGTAPQQSRPSADDAAVIADLRQAKRLHDQGDYEAAMAVYDAMELSRSTNAAVWYARARTEQALGRHDAARLDAERGMARDPRVARLLTPHYVRALREAMAEQAVAVAALNAAVPWGAAIAAHSMLTRIDRSLPPEVRIEMEQRALAFAGHYDGPVDGISGPATRLALDACIADACWTRFTDAM